MTQYLAQFDLFPFSITFGLQLQLSSKKTIQIRIQRLMSCSRMSLHFRYSLLLKVFFHYNLTKSIHLAYTVYSVNLV